MFRATLFSLALVSMSNPALADEVTDTLTSAMDAYEEGDIDYAIEELDYAKQLLQAMKTAELTAFLPEAPAGWTREVSEEMNTGLAMLGGGMGAEAEYSDGADSFTITIMANNPMVTAMGAMVSNAAMLGMKLERVGRQKFVNDDGELTGLVDNRILIQASGADVDLMVGVLENIDYEALEDFAR
ncbi:hypothetical protein FVF75_05560 [Maritimibacter fusiformis]|uniref:Uncharacterized protein n=2 Tax=Maritimibacter fusiformis TaxID=2603819 RepID=A0A5D0RMX7_9RHOB|nr:hypothetical protein FVF75_05560 [Maritimibacter fusiformis]